MKKFGGTAYWTNAFIEAFKSAGHSLLSHKLRTSLTLLSIFIGVATIIILVSVIGGLNGNIAKEFAQLGTNSLYVSRQPWSMSHDTWFLWRNAPRVDMNDVRSVHRAPSTDKVVYNIDQYGIKVENGQNYMVLNIKGTTWELPLVQPLADVTEGRFFNYGEFHNGKPVCVLGGEVYENLFPTGNAIGKKIKIAGRQHIVVGILKKQGNNMFTGNHDQTVIIPYNTFLKLFGRQGRFQILVLPKSPKLVEQLREELRYYVRNGRGLRPWQPDNFAVNSQDMLLDDYKKITKNIWAAIIAIAALSLLVGGIGVMNIMLITVTERTREIGIRKSLGATRTHILAQFLLEALAQCWIGGICGFLVGTSLPFMISIVVKQLPFALSWGSVAVAIGFTTFVGVVFGLYPAMKAARLSPVEALRHE